MNPNRPLQIQRQSQTQRQLQRRPPKKEKAGGRYKIKVNGKIKRAHPATRDDRRKINFEDSSQPLERGGGFWVLLLD
jgi:hypothetical protein